MSENDESGTQGARTPYGAGVINDERWQVRIGQIETVLQFFGTLCSVSIERSTGSGSSAASDTVYVQAQRVDGGVELEMTGPGYLYAGALGEAQAALMADLGWAAPDGEVSPNFTRFVPDEADLHEVAVGVARAFAEVYAARPDGEWVVSPSEFGNAGAGLAPFEVLDLHDECGETDDVDDDIDDDVDGDAADDVEDERSPAEKLMAARRRILREGSGAELLAVVESTAVTWEDLIEAGLPRGDKRAELVMLYRADCPLEFHRASGFHHDVLADPSLPTSTALAVLGAQPTAYEVARLSRRRDFPRAELATASARGAKLANWRGRSGSAYLRLDVMPTARLVELSAVQDADAAGMLQHPRCPEEIVLKHALSRSALLRHLALVAIKQRGIEADRLLLRMAKAAPMTERTGTRFPYADRVRVLAAELLTDR